jgi:hypothetical protein
VAAMQQRRVILQLVSLQWAYWVAVAMSIWALSHLGPGSIRNLLILTPVLPGLLMIAWTSWVYQACDEFIKARILSAAAITAAVIAVGSLIYSYLELTGLPRISMAWTSNIGWAVFGVLMLGLLFQR